MGFSRQEYWSGLPCPPPEDLPNSGSNPGLPHCRQILYHLRYQGNPRILEWVAYPFSRGSSWPRDQTGVSCLAGGCFTSWATRKAPSLSHMLIQFPELCALVYQPYALKIIKCCWSCFVFSFKNCVDGRAKAESRHFWTKILFLYC